jgi:hypothetical protein
MSAAAARAEPALQPNSRDRNTNGRHSGGTERPTGGSRLPHPRAWSAPCPARARSPSPHGGGPTSGQHHSGPVSLPPPARRCPVRVAAHGTVPSASARARTATSRVRRPPVQAAIADGPRRPPPGADHARVGRPPPMTPASCAAEPYHVLRPPRTPPTRSAASRDVRTRTMEARVPASQPRRKRPPGSRLHCHPNPEMASATASARTINARSICPYRIVAPLRTTDCPMSRVGQGADVHGADTRARSSGQYCPAQDPRSTWASHNSDLLHQPLQGSTAVARDDRRYGQLHKRLRSPRSKALEGHSDPSRRRFCVTPTGRAGSMRSQPSADGRPSASLPVAEPGTSQA